MKRYCIATMLMLSTISGLAIAAGPGTLDPSFGKGGIVITSFGNDVRPIDVALQNDEKIVVAGGLNDFRIASELAFVVRYLPDVDCILTQLLNASRSGRTAVTDECHWFSVPLGTTLSCAFDHYRDVDHHRYSRSLSQFPIPMDVQGAQTAH